MRGIYQGILELSVEVSSVSGQSTNRRYSQSKYHLVGPHPVNSQILPSLSLRLPQEPSDMSKKRKSSVGDAVWRSLHR